MAAGLGFKTFTTGEVLTAADVNGYLMQGVLVFASEAARNSAITSPQEGQFAYTKDNNSLWYYTGSAWAASGATGDIEGVTAGVGISGGGTSGTVTITNSMATEIDAKGDLVVGTGADTFARLPVGTNGYTLVADSSTATGLAYAAPASSGLTLISRQSFSNVANTGTTFDNVFSSTYKTYQVVIEVMRAATSGNNAQFQLLRSGTTQATGYAGVVLRIVTNSTVSYVISPSTNFDMANDTGDTLYNLRNTITLSGVGVSGRAFWYTNGWDGAAVVAIVGGGYVDDAQTYTGILFKSDSSNITGTVAIYGLAV